MYFSAEVSRRISNENAVLHDPRPYDNFGADRSLRAQLRSGCMGKPEPMKWVCQAYRIRAHAISLVRNVHAWTRANFEQLLVVTPGEVYK